MKYLYYFKYFYFIARNWNIKLAAFTVYHEIKGERKYHLDTVKIDRLHHEKIESANITHASIYQASSYYLVEKAYKYLEDEKVNYGLVDFGCGKGRVLILAAYYGFKKITGIDFSRNLVLEAEANIEKVSQFFPNTVFNVICDDAVNYKIEKDKNCFFFFNPFDEVIMLKVIKNILSSLKEDPRKIYVVYINPLDKEIFLSAGFEEEWSFKKMEYLEFSILSKKQETFHSGNGLEE
ncbi:MAG: class I SAM-dependent methyltransferase [Bacteroidota bacterium]|nr:class I SAM-dependent methyltransferase [Bacteroidota bacterium]